jgi:hypothetical protein
VGIEIRSQPPESAADDLPVIAWRCEQLLLVGFHGEQAEQLARDWRYDLHALIELVERGCEPSLAARILAPLDTPPKQPRLDGHTRACDRNQTAAPLKPR